MEKKTKHGDVNGHRLFCQCDGVDYGKVNSNREYTDDQDLCMECGYFPWYYLNPADEPQQEG